MIRETLQQFFRSCRRAPLAWLGLLVIATGTNAVDLIFGKTEVGFSNAQILSLIIRVAGTFWLVGVAIRKLVGSPPQAWSLDRGFAFLLIWQIAVFGLEAIASFLLVTAKNAAAPSIPLRVDPYILTLAFVALATPLVEVLSLRVAPWLVGRTAIAPDMTFGVAWRGMRGSWGAAVKVYLVFVLPLFAIHYALTAWLQHAHISEQPKLQWTMFDGIESIIMLMLLVSLFVASFLRAKPQA